MPKALFRGRDSNEARLTLAQMALKNSEVLDAGITSYNFRKADESKWGPMADYVALSDMGNWKYNLLLDGTVAAYRAPYTVLKCAACIYRLYIQLYNTVCIIQLITS